MKKLIIVTSVLILTNIAIAQNIGIGTNTPNLGKLVVRGVVGNTSAVFGDLSGGISVENDLPAIGFNSYRNNGRRAISAGYGGSIQFDPVLGSFSLTNSINSTTAGNIFFSSTPLTIDVAGNIGIGNVNPQVPLSFSVGYGKRISLSRGSTGDMGMGVFSNEFRINSDARTSNISFGFDSLPTGFTENVRFEGTGDVHVGTYGVWNNATYDRRLKFGDGLFCYIGEVGGDDAMELKAGKFTFKNGAVAIGNTASPFASGYKLSVDGKIISEEVRVLLKTSWPDYVFAENYKLPDLNNLENFINVNKHLPNIPSADEVKNGGILLGDMNAKLLEKIEELSLYIIQLNKKIEAQQMVTDTMQKALAEKTMH